MREGFTKVGLILIEIGDGSIAGFDERKVLQHAILDGSGNAVRLVRTLHAQTHPANGVGIDVEVWSRREIPRARNRMEDDGVKCA